MRVVSGVRGAARPVPAADAEPAPEPVTPGTAGASARRDYARRTSRREERIRWKHPRLARLILALSDDPATTRVWAQGARGEELLGARLDALTGDGVRLLHDRRIPGGRAISGAGVFVIDAKRYPGRRPALRVEGGLLRPRVETLMVGSRDCTRLVDGMQRQLGAVRVVLATAELADVPLTGMPCFVDADWPLFGGSFTIRGIDVLWPSKATERITRTPTGDGAPADRLHRVLAEVLLPA